MIPLAFKLPTPYIIINMAGSGKICQNKTEMEKCTELWVWRVSSGLCQITIIITKMRIKYCSICKAAPLFQYTVSKMLRDGASRNCLWSCSFRHKHLQGSRKTFPAWPQPGSPGDPLQATLLPFIDRQSIQSDSCTQLSLCVWVPILSVWCGAFSSSQNSQMKFHLFFKVQNKYLFGCEVSPKPLIYLTIQNTWSTLL